MTKINPEENSGFIAYSVGGTCGAGVFGFFAIIFIVILKLYDLS